MTPVVEAPRFTTKSISRPLRTSQELKLRSLPAVSGAGRGGLSARRLGSKAGPVGTRTRHPMTRGAASPSRKYLILLINMTKPPTHLRKLGGDGRERPRVMMASYFCRRPWHSLQERRHLPCHPVQWPTVLVQVAVERTRQRAQLAKDIEKIWESPWTPAR